MLISDQRKPMKCLKDSISTLMKDSFDKIEIAINRLSH
jgi:hypothetical protein